MDEYKSIDEVACKTPERNKSSRKAALEAKLQTLEKELTTLKNAQASHSQSKKPVQKKRADGWTFACVISILIFVAVLAITWYTLLHY